MTRIDAVSHLCADRGKHAANANACYLRCLRADRAAGISDRACGAEQPQIDRAGQAATVPVGISTNVGAIRFRH